MISLAVCSRFKPIILLEFDIWNAVRHSCTGSANGKNGLNPGFMHHAVWKMGGVDEKQKAALCQSQDTESQTSCVTVDGLGA